ncbi:hypothetical protein AVEN_48050-1 [Araneus ventricosus]|uniref:Uncharacterized protein n=1 Tax=Araneus ventricosus TaxID=182803 RepID=A0A4Y2LXW5_ARAVE|nr:hypothetical protein AVEN_48050-1 [Araneus ventricosus]
MLANEHIYSFMFLNPFWCQIREGYIQRLPQAKPPSRQMLIASEENLNPLLSQHRSEIASKVWEGRIYFSNTLSTAISFCGRVVQLAASTSSILSECHFQRRFAFPPSD